MRQVYGNQKQRSKGKSPQSETPVAINKIRNPFLKKALVLYLLLGCDQISRV
jgi:hypothetical protein